LERHEEACGREHDKGLLEASLFLATTPLSYQQLARILGEASPAYVERLLEELSNELAADDRGIELRLNEGQAFLQVKQRYIRAVAHLAPQQDIPRPVLRTLAMIAYNHPMTQADLVKARGNKAYGHIQQLIERGLVRAEKQGRTLLLHVTKEFLRYFGLSSVEEFRFHVEPPLPET
jgi:segregation and condensation protein B